MHRMFDSKALNAEIKSHQTNLKLVMVDFLPHYTPGKISGEAFWSANRLRDSVNVYENLIKSANLTPEEQEESDILISMIKGPKLGKGPENDPYEGGLLSDTLSPLLAKKVSNYLIAEGHDAKLAEAMEKLVEEENAANVQITGPGGN